MCQSGKALTVSRAAAGPIAVRQDRKTVESVGTTGQEMNPNSPQRLVGASQELTTSSSLKTTALALKATDIKIMLLL